MSTPREVVVRLASLDDASAVVGVYCSDVERWLDSRGKSRRYEELSVAERFMHGGPWMSIETCSVHLNYLLTHGQYPLVAEVNGRVVGELELIVGPDDVLGMTAHIDVLMVHREHRRRGIGRALVEKAREIGEARGCDALSVCAERRAVGFYQRLGLRRVAHHVAFVSVKCRRALSGTEVVLDESAFFPYFLIERLTLVSPRSLTHFAAWLKSQWRYALLREGSDQVSGVIRELDARFVIRLLPSLDRRGTLFLWVRDQDVVPDALKTCLTVATRLGVERLCIALRAELLDKLRDIKFSLDDRAPVLYTPLK